jgi:hypothetical protein
MTKTLSSCAPISLVQKIKDDGNGFGKSMRTFKKNGTKYHLWGFKHSLSACQLFVFFLQVVKNLVLVAACSQQCVLQGEYWPHCRHSIGTDTMWYMEPMYEPMAYPAALYTGGVEISGGVQSCRGY